MTDRTKQGTGQSVAVSSKIWGLAGAVAFMLVVYVLPTPAPMERNGEIIALTVNGKACLAVLAFAVTLWVTEALPFAVTSLFVVLLIPVFGVADYATVVAAGFGNPIITFFIGVLILSSGFVHSGLGTRLVLNVLRVFGTRTDRVLLGFLVVGAMLSMWITDMAVAAILLPLGVGILRDARLEPRKSNFGRALMIACAYGPLIGGIATPAGTGANPIAIGYLRELGDLEISFIRWMALGVPAALLMLPFGWIVLLKIFPPEMKELPLTKEEVTKKIRDLGRRRGQDFSHLRYNDHTLGSHTSVVKFHKRGYQSTDPSCRPSGRTVSLSSRD